MSNTRSQNTIRYHEKTKHLPNRYARSAGALDWKNQPEPFRLFEGAPIKEFSFDKNHPDIEYSSLFKNGENKFQEFSFENIGSFMELSMGLSAWKSLQGSSWVLRINPSSGNLHPTEAYLVLPPMAEFSNYGGVFHYNPYLHAVEGRARVGKELWEQIKDHFGQNGFLVELSTIFWRESWKYGERAFRYCNHDVGHAMACLSFSANLLGWKITYLNSLSDDETGTILGLNKTQWGKYEEEHADLMFYVHKDNDEEIPRSIRPEIITAFEALTFKGKPNRLSKEHVDWDIIDQVASWTLKPATDEQQYRYKNHDFLKDDVSSKNVSSKKAYDVIRQRRSAQAYDAKTSITKEQFFCMMDKTIARNNKAPFNLELGEISVHLVIFVHRVSGLDSGIYFLVRNEMDLDDIKAKTHSNFLWEKAEETPDTLPLYLLKTCDFRVEAQMISCQQEIAGDGAFSLGMIAKFRENVEKFPYLYRHLFWEAGMIGQVLYLEAEAHSVRGTGIGCFFDDLVHDLLGFNDNSYQSLYHFTVGGPVEDERLTTLPPYYHLKR
ncbi:MAG: SagB/ThcOx family dehydrogenase [Candidatus Anammoxibacter sp.]